MRVQKLMIWILHMLCCVTPFAFTWINEELFEFNKIIVLYVCATLLAGLWIFQALTQLQTDKTLRWWHVLGMLRSLTTRLSPVDWLFMLFVVTQWLATLSSIHPHTSWFGYYTRFHGGLWSWVCYGIVYATARYAARTPAQVAALLRTIMLAALGVGIWAIGEHYGHSLSCILIAQRFDTACWAPDVRARVFATFGQPNWLAAYIVMMVPLAATLHVWLQHPHVRPHAMRSIGAAASVFFILVVIATKSRSAWLALGVMVLGCVVMWWGRMWQGLRTRSTPKTLARKHKQSKQRGRLSRWVMWCAGVYVGVPLAIYAAIQLRVVPPIWEQVDVGHRAILASALRAAYNPISCISARFVRARSL
jgi:hypothetical protein